MAPTATGAGVSNLHSARGNAATAFAAVDPSTFLASNFSMRRTVPGPASGGRLQPAAAAAIAIATSAVHAPRAFRRPPTSLAMTASSCPRMLEALRIISEACLTTFPGGE